MKILVTGGAGYLGSIMVPKLLNEGHEVTVVDSFLYGQTSLLDCCYSDKLKIIRGDVRDKNLISKNIEDKDILILLACIVGAPACDKRPIEAKTINYDAIKMILHLRKKKQKVLYPCTNSGYGIGQKNIYCDEKTPLKPISLYSRLKVNAEKEVLKTGNSISLRLATVFGISPRMRFDLLVNDFVYRALMDRSITLFEAHFKRNYVYIGDVARAFIHCINNFDKLCDQPYNVGLSEANLSKWDLCEEIKKQIPKFWFTEYTEEDWAKDPDKRNYIISNKKIEATGYKAKTTLQEGISELINGYQIIRRNQYSNL
jgi:nucleoside-diphosphate-sugar epimerase